jgi:hypothetical protein
VSLEHQNPAIIDDRHVEALSLSADINADPHSHASKDAPLQYRPRSDRARRDLTGPEVARGAGTTPRPGATAVRYRPSRYQLTNAQPCPASAGDVCWAHWFSPGAAIGRAAPLPRQEPARVHRQAVHLMAPVHSRAYLGTPAYLRGLPACR